jgi:hypothetical protein
MSRENSERNILGGQMTMLPFSGTDNEQLLREYAFFLAYKAEGAIEASLRTVRQVMIWVASHPGNGGVFQPQQLTKTAVEMYLASLEREGLSVHHHTRVKSALSTFARWLIEEKCLLLKNPTIQTLAPRQLATLHLMTASLHLPQTVQVVLVMCHNDGQQKTFLEGVQHVHYLRKARPCRLHHNQPARGTQCH